MCLNLSHQLVNRDRFREPAADAWIECSWGGGRLAAHDDDGDFAAVDQVETVENLSTIHQRHEPVEQDHIRPLTLEALDRLGPGRRQLDLVPALIQADGI